MKRVEDKKRNVSIEGIHSQIVKEEKIVILIKNNKEIKKYYKKKEIIVINAFFGKCSCDFI